MANAYFYTSTAVQAQLIGSISAGSLVGTINDSTGWPTSYPFIAAIDYGSSGEELVKVTNNSANTLTFTRAFNGTSAQSHSLGAIVRHVYCAQDATDFRTHEGNTANVHGVTGSVVGTTDNQTLTNKTYSGGILSGTFTGAPTLSGAVVLSGTPSITNGAALAGTFTGTPTFNGAVTFSGAPVFSGTPSFNTGAALAGTFSGTPTFSGAVTLNGGGTLAGTFTGTPTFSGAVVLSGTPSITNGAALAGTLSGTPTFSGLVTATTGIKGNGISTNTPMFRTLVTGDSTERGQWWADGSLHWGPGNAALDTDLYRLASNSLQTDGAFTALGAISGSNYPSTAWQAFSPTWNTTTALHTPSIGNGTLAMRWQQYGKTVVFVMRLKAGSTTNYNSGVASDNWLFSLPTAASASMLTGGTGSSFPIGYVSMAANGADAKLAGGFAVLNTTGDFTIQVSTGEVDAVAIASTGFIDAVTPFTWTTSGYLVITGTYEAA